MSGAFAESEPSDDLPAALSRQQRRAPFYAARRAVGEELSELTAQLCDLAGDYPDIDIRVPDSEGPWPAIKLLSQSQLIRPRGETTDLKAYLGERVTSLRVARRNVTFMLAELSKRNDKGERFVVVVPGHRVGKPLYGERKAMLDELAELGIQPQPFKTISRPIDMTLGYVGPDASEAHAQSLLQAVRARTPFLADLLAADMPDPHTFDSRFFGHSPPR